MISQCVFLYTALARKRPFQKSLVKNSYYEWMEATWTQVLRLRGGSVFPGTRSFMSTTGLHQMFDEQGLRGTMCRLLLIKSVSVPS